MEIYQIYQAGAEDYGSQCMSSGRKAYVGAVAVIPAPHEVSQPEAEAFLTEHYSERLNRRNLSTMHKIFSNRSIAKRTFAFNNPVCLLNEAPDDRIARFTWWATELSSQAAFKALEQAGLAADDVSAIVVNTCTGYVCPGLSSYLIEKMGLPRTVQAYDLVGNGCGGAIPNLQISGSSLHGDGRVALSISVEICSATFQMENDLGLILSNALFGDGAAAAVVWDRPEGFELVASSSRYSTEHRDHIRYVHKNGQLYNQITTQLPRIVKIAVGEAVTDFLESRSLTTLDIKHWAVHTGGEKIINEIGGELGLSEQQLLPARSVLKKFGNMSSPTVWFVMREIMDAGIEENEWVMMVAFGAGLSAHTYLLRKV
jgi:predicted naringenin-chalcone synthase